MSECFRCGISSEVEQLYDAVSSEGIVKVCKRCAVLENLPLIKKPTENQITESQRHRTVQERLTSMTRPRTLNREVTLRDLIDKKFNSGNPHPDLVENFHWTIQRIKRARRITREQFAKAIGESEATIRMVEQGFLPENNYKVISKIENYLGVSLRKSGSSGFPDTEDVPKKFSLEESSSKNLKIEDLKEIKKRQENSNKESSSWEQDYSEEDLFYEDPEYLDDSEKG